MDNKTEEISNIMYLISKNIDFSNKATSKHDKLFYENRIRGYEKELETKLKQTND